MDNFMNNFMDKKQINDEEIISHILRDAPQILKNKIDALLLSDQHFQVRYRQVEKMALHFQQIDLATLEQVLHRPRPVANLLPKYGRLALLSLTFFMLGHYSNDLSWWKSPSKELENSGTGTRMAIEKRVDINQQYLSEVL